MEDDELDENENKVTESGNTRNLKKLNLKFTMRVLPKHTLTRTLTRTGSGEG